MPAGMTRQWWGQDWQAATVLHAQPRRLAATDGRFGHVLKEYRAWSFVPCKAEILAPHMWCMSSRWSSWHGAVRDDPAWYLASWLHSTALFCLLHASCLDRVFAVLSMAVTLPNSPQPSSGQRPCDHLILQLTCRSRKTCLQSDRKPSAPAADWTLRIVATS